MLIIPNSNGEDNRPLREFNANHDHRGRFAASGSASALTDSASSHPRQPIPPTSVPSAARRAASVHIATNPKEYDTATALAILGPRVAKAATALVRDKAPLAQQELLAGLETFARKTGAVRVESKAALQTALVTPGMAVITVGPPKGLRRILQKALGSSGDISQIKDAVRATVAVDRLEDVPKMMKALGDVGLTPVGRVSNRFDTPTSMGYRDLKFNVRLPGTNVVGEMQVHIKTLLAAKEGIGHTYYAEQRTIAEAAKVQKRTYTPAERDRVRELTRLSQQLYGDAYHAAGGR